MSRIKRFEASTGFPAQSVGAGVDGAVEPVGLVPDEDGLVLDEGLVADGLPEVPEGFDPIGFTAPSVPTGASVPMGLAPKSAGSWPIPASSEQAIELAATRALLENTSIQ